MITPFFAFAILFAADGNSSKPKFEIALTRRFFQNASPQNHGPIETWIWYPTQEPSNLQDFYEKYRQPNAKLRQPKPAPGCFPLIVFSHGLTGTPDQSSFITNYLVERGYIVIAPEHWGTSNQTFLPDRLFSSSLGRPHEINVILEAVLSESRRGLESSIGRIDERRIGAMGHSLGGTTVLALAGGLVGAKDVADPKSQLQLPDFYEFRDSRIKAVVAYSPKMSPPFQPQSFQKVTIPLLLFGATRDVVADTTHQQKIYDLWRGPAHLAFLQGGSHFNFFDEELIQQANPMVRALHLPTINRAKGDEIVQRLTYEFLERHLNGLGTDSAWSLTTTDDVKTMSKGDIAVATAAVSESSFRECGKQANRRSNHVLPRRRFKQ